MVADRAGAKYGGASSSHGEVTERLLTAREVAEILGLQTRTIWTLAERGEIACIRLGRAVRFAPEDLASYLQQHRQEATW